MFRKKIKWNELEKYINKPVYDEKRKEWRILKGYKQYGNEKRVTFTDIDYWETLNDFELYEQDLDWEDSIK